MPNLNVLSWNVESFGEKKLTLTPRFIALTAIDKNIDILLIMEGSPNSSYDIYQRLYDELNELENIKNSGFSWNGFTSDPTGKEPELPDSINPNAAFKGDNQMKNAYWNVFKLCYDEIYSQFYKTNIWKKKQQLNDNNIKNCIAAAINANILKTDKETYIVMFKYNESKLSNGVMLYGNNDSGLVISSQCSLQSQKLSGNTYNSLVNNQTHKELKDIGYQDPESSFNGRTPFYIPLSVYKLNDNNWYLNYHLPLILFHAPFGSNQQLRVDANRGLIKLALPMQTGYEPITDQKAFILCGDFNINYSPDAKTGSSSDQFYGYYKKEKGCNMSILTPSTLTANPDKVINKNDPINFLVNAYDNIIIKNNISGKGEILNFVKILTNDNIYNQKFREHNAINDPGTPNYVESTKWYKEQISDHLPAFAELTLPDN